MMNDRDWNWGRVALWAENKNPDAACIMELEERVSALESKSTPTAYSGGLLDQVSCAIHPSRYPDPYVYQSEAKAALCAVALWMRKQDKGWDDCADAIEREVRR
jgi:hypothetical protein